MTTDESGDVGFYLCNKSLQKVSIIAEIQLRGKMKASRYSEIKRIFQHQQSWGYKTFLKKDTLDNKMKSIVDGSGHLNIHLKISCENKMLMKRYSVRVQGVTSC